MVKIYGFAQSTCTQRVLTTLIELQIPYEFVTIDFAAREHKSATFIQLQPWGKVPVLEDEGFILFESRAICKYLAVKYTNSGTKLVPQMEDTIAYGLFEQACSIEQNYFNEPTAGLAFEMLFKAMHGKGPADEAVVAKYTAQLDAALKVYDGILSKTTYLAGELFTLADLYHLPYGNMVIELGFKENFQKYRNVWAWWERVSGRDSWRKVVEGKVALRK